jgi:tetratricopeptide (TPR) repeat protein
MRVSLCMIVRNEQENLPDCLESASDLFDEIIVGDTGSTDDTLNVAASLGAKVRQMRWPDSFAEARNASLAEASGDWIFWLDADDRIDAANRERWLALRSRLKREMVGYVMKCRCLPCRVTGRETVVDHLRLFPNHPTLRWKYRVHEQILPALRAVGGNVAWSDVEIQHTGYQDPAARAGKVRRDLRLLLLDHVDFPDDPFILFNLGWCHKERKRPVEALPHLRRSLRLSRPTDSIVRKLYALLAQCHREMGNPALATAICREGLQQCPGDDELLFELADLLEAAGELDEAELRYAELLRPATGQHFASIDPALRGVHARARLERLRARRMS